MAGMCGLIVDLLIVFGLLNQSPIAVPCRVSLSP